MRGPAGNILLNRFFLKSPWVRFPAICGIRMRVAGALRSPITMRDCAMRKRAVIRQNRRDYSILGYLIVATLSFCGSVAAPFGLPSQFATSDLAQPLINYRRLPLFGNITLLIRQSPLLMYIYGGIGIDNLLLLSSVNQLQTIQAQPKIHC